MITLQNNQLIVKINKWGAELQSVIDRKSDYEFIWQADEEYWGRYAPVLFPIIGRLKQNHYRYEGKEFEMTQHGFARDSLFEVVKNDANSAVFSLEYNKDTLKVYPFHFKLLIHYTLDGQQLTIDYEVINLSTTDVMYYSIGGHPAFNVSQCEERSGQLEFNKVFLELQPERLYKQIPISKAGLTQLGQITKILGGRKKLRHESFKNDALIYEMDEDSQIRLQDETKNIEIKIETQAMNYVGVWSPYPKEAGFICLEPWTGFADSEQSTGEYSEKEEVSFLDKDEKRTHTYTVKFMKD